MSSRGTEVTELTDFKRGYNNELSPSGLPAGTATVATDVTMEDGSIRPRPGVATVAASGATLHHWRFLNIAESGSARAYFWRVEDLSNTSASPASGTGCHLVDASGAKAGGEAYKGSGALVASAWMNSFCPKTDGTAIPYVCYTGRGTLAQAGGVASGAGGCLAYSLEGLDLWFAVGGGITPSPLNDYPVSYIVNHKNSVWGLGGNGLLYWSKYRPDEIDANQRLFLAGGATTLAVNTGDQLISAASFQGNLVVFSREKVFSISGLQPDGPTGGTLVVTELPPLPGCAGPASVAAQNYGIVYLNDSGVYLFDGFTSTELSREIRSEIAAYTFLQKYTAHGVFLDETTYALTFPKHPGGLSSSVTYIFDLKGNKSVYKWNLGNIAGIQPGIRVAANTPGTGLLYLCTSAAGSTSDDDPNIYKLDPATTQDKGANFTWTWRGVLGLGNNALIKKVRRLWVRDRGASAVTVNVKLVPVGSTESPPTRTANFGTQDRIKVEGLHTAGQVPSTDYILEINGTTSAAAQPDIDNIVVESYVQNRQ